MENGKRANGRENIQRKKSDKENCTKINKNKNKREIKILYFS